MFGLTRADLTDAQRDTIDRLNPSNNEDLATIRETYGDALQHHISTRHAQQFRPQAPRRLTTDVDIIAQIRLKRILDEEAIYQYNRQRSVGEHTNICECGRPFISPTEVVGLEDYDAKMKHILDKHSGYQKYKHDIFESWAARYENPQNLIIYAQHASINNMLNLMLVWDNSRTWPCNECGLPVLQWKNGRVVGE